MSETALAGTSCYVFDVDRRVYETRRALGKRTWAGVWTNSFCGHPAPGGRIVDAVHRRSCQEPDEVMERTWVSWCDLRSAAEFPWALSPWAAEQIPLLDAFTRTGHDPSSSTNSAKRIY